MDSQTELLDKYGEMPYRQFRYAGIDMNPEDSIRENELLATYGDNWYVLRMSAKEGDVVSFGRYEQDNDTGNGPEPISWRVLKRTDGEMWLLSEYILDAVPYVQSKPDSFDETAGQEDWNVTGSLSWQESDLFAWLNGRFLSDAFTEQERTALVRPDTDLSSVGGAGLPDVEESENGIYRARLLTEEEAISYLFSSMIVYYNSDRTDHESLFEYAVPERTGKEVIGSTVYIGSAYSTAYAEANGLRVMNGKPATGAWWLLTRDLQYGNGYTGRGRSAQYSDYMGSIGMYDSEDPSIGVRPLICLTLAP